MILSYDPNVWFLEEKTLAKSKFCSALMEFRIAMHSKLWFTWHKPYINTCIRNTNPWKFGQYGNIICYYCSSSMQHLRYKESYTYSHKESLLVLYINLSTSYASRHKLYHFLWTLPWMKLASDLTKFCFFMLLLFYFLRGTQFIRCTFYLLFQLIYNIMENWYINLGEIMKE